MANNLTLPAIARSVGDYEREVGEQIRRLRFQVGLDQVQLAELAAVSRGAVKGLEAGRGSTLSTLIKVLRALKQEDWLFRLSPQATISPMQIWRDQRLLNARKKVYRARGSKRKDET
ncbi:hypothetical protein GCM10027296_21320 [Chitinimonas naiadis]